MSKFEFNCEGWPDGSRVFCEVLNKHNPNLADAPMKPLAFGLLGFPDLEGCSPVKGKDQADFILQEESTLVAMLVQALSERVQAALYETDNVDAVANCHRAVRVIYSAIKYLPGGAHDE